VDELETEFSQSMDTYFEHYKKTDTRPDKPYSGRLNFPTFQIFLSA